jgi:hypothetical protein
MTTFCIAFYESYLSTIRTMRYDEGIHDTESKTNVDVVIKSKCNHKKQEGGCKEI